METEEEQRVLSGLQCAIASCLGWRAQRVNPGGDSAGWVHWEMPGGYPDPAGIPGMPQFKTECELLLRQLDRERWPKQGKPGEINRVALDSCSSGARALHIGTPWFLNAESYHWFLDRAGVIESEYVKNIHALLRVLPYERAHMLASNQMLKMGTVPAPRLHPRTNGRIEYYPVPILVSGLVRGISVTTALFELGGLIRRTEAVDGAYDLAKRICDRTEIESDLSPFTSDLFELEVLAELVKSGMDPTIVSCVPGRRTPDFHVTVSGIQIFIEARHRGISEETSLWNDIRARIWRIHDKLCGQGELRVRILRACETLADMDYLRTEIPQKIERMMKSGEPDSYSSLSFEVDYQMTSDSGLAVICEWGNGDEDEQIAYAVSSVLQEKSEQLALSAKQGNLCFVALDVRSLLPVAPVDADADGSRLYNAASLACQQFVCNNEVISGVLLWTPARTPDAASTYSLLEPEVIQLVTCDGASVCDPTIMLATLESFTRAWIVKPKVNVAHKN
jgi:hypothetical protein